MRCIFVHGPSPSKKKKSENGGRRLQLFVVCRNDTVSLHSFGEDAHMRSEITNFFLFFH